MEMKGKLIRTCTLNENVQDLLLEYLKDDDMEELENLLKEEIVEVNYIYKDASEFYYEDKNALQIACAYFADETSEKCIQLLLEYGADLFYADPDSQKNSINFAAESGNCEILKTILKFIQRKQLDINNSDVIYTLIKYIRDSEMNEEKYVSILKLLLETDIDINYQNIDSGWTTIYIAAKYKYQLFVQIILDMKKAEINLDEFKDRKGKSARDLIIDQKLYKGELPEYTEENSNVTIFTLYKNIRGRSVEDFTENFDTIEQNLNENDKYLLLNMAVKYRMEKIVKILLDKGVNYEQYYSNNQDNPMIIAAQRGYFKIIKLFMSTKPNSELVNQAIFELLKTTYTTEQSENVNYIKCLTFLLKSENLEINAKDYNDNTALHYALRYQDPEMALKILRRGARLGCKDSFNRLAIADMDSQTLETHLNECIYYENEEISTREDACLIINFTSLLPTENHKIQPEKCCEKIAVDVESQKSTEIITNEVFVPETEVLQYMCTSQELKQHLKHPVILAFLFLKWYRISKYFYMNLSLYIVFVLSLLSYITFGYNTKGGTEHQFVTNISYGILMFSFILLLIREISQIVLYKHKYLYTFENWLEIILLIVTTGILTEKPNEPLMRQFSAIAIVAAAIEFLLLVGQFPAMSTNIMMLRTVSYTFFKLLLWYSILLFAFSYSFYTLFQETGEEKQTNGTAGVDNNNHEEDEEQDFFVDPGMSLLKTIVMLTGEFDAASIKFDTFPVISHLIFVIFVFLIAIVLFNLLNGLAVSDTQIIKNDAELYGQILRVQHIAHIEQVLLTNKFIQWVPAIKRVSLFPLNTKKAEALVYPNQNSKVRLLETMGNNVRIPRPANCFRVFFGIYFDKKIQREIRSLMKELKEDKGRKKMDEQLLAEIADLRNVIKTLINKQS